MNRRAFTVVLLVSSLLSSSPALAVELDGAADTSSSVSLAHAAIASSTVAAPAALRPVDTERPQVGLPVLVSLESAAARVHEPEVVPTVFAARPDVSTCPAQGPPVRS